MHASVPEGIIADEVVAWLKQYTPALTEPVTFDLIAGGHRISKRDSHGRARRRRKDSRRRGHLAELSKRHIREHAECHVVFRSGAFFAKDDQFFSHTACPPLLLTSTHIACPADGSCAIPNATRRHRAETAGTIRPIVPMAGTANTRTAQGSCARARRPPERTRLRRRRRRRSSLPSRLSPNRSHRAASN